MKKLIAAAAAATAVLSCGAATAAEPPRRVDVLVFTETTAFRHASIADGVTMFQSLAAADPVEGVDLVVETVNNSVGVFTDEGLERFEVVVWLSTTGNPLDTTEQAAYERWTRAGGGFVGIHAGADNEYNWPFYGDLAGAQFASHPAGTPQASLDVEDASTVATAHLPKRWTRSDEWYNFRRNPRKYVCNTATEVGPVETQTLLEPVPGLPFPGSLVEDPDLQPPAEYDTRPQDCGVHVLLTLDESTYANNGDAMGDHPIAWCHDYEGATAFYTGLGHTAASYTEPGFVQHVTGGLLMASGEAPCQTA